MKKRALIIGLTTVDIQHFISEFPSPNQKIKTEPPHIYVGGPAANAAVTYSFLGGEVDFISCIGENPFSQFILEDLHKHNLKVIDFKHSRQFTPIISSVLTTVDSNDRSIVSHYPEKLKISEEEIDAIDLDKYNLVFTDGFYPEIAVPLCIKAKNKGIQVIFDGGSWKPCSDEIVNNIDIAICSDNFFPPECDETDKVIRYLREKGVEKVAVTRGEKSIIFSENGHSDKILIEQVQTGDSLGAGDIFHGAFLWYWSNGNNFNESLLKASKIATYSTRFKGTRSWMKAISENSFF